MSSAPPPLETPVPPEPAPGDSGVRLLTKRELREIKEAEAKVAKSKRRLNFIYGSVGVVITTVVITLSVTAWAQSKVDAGVEKGVAPVEKRVAVVETDLASTKVAVQQLQLDGVRNTTMLEMLVKERRMEPPPPAPKVSLPDGGAP